MLGANVIEVSLLRRSYSVVGASEVAESHFLKSGLVNHEIRNVTNRIEATATNV